MFRDLKPEEIDVRAQQVKENGIILLLYKDARCDMNILDETVGPINWQREHTRDNANCIVSIWDDNKSQWISKEDTGTESQTEKEKGQASDSFKRACFNWGIGRELYTSPFIWIKPKNDKEIFKNNKGKFTTYTKFSVDSITIVNKVITGIVIKDDKGVERFNMGQAKQAPKKITQTQAKTLDDLITVKKADKAKVLEYYKVKSIEDMTPTVYAKALKALQAK